MTASVGTLILWTLLLFAVEDFTIFFINLSSFNATTKLVLNTVVRLVGIFIILHFLRVF